MHKEIAEDGNYNKDLVKIKNSLQGGEAVSIQDLLALLRGKRISDRYNTKVAYCINEWI